MMAASPEFRPAGAAIAAWSRRLMDVILHIGAHRTATTTFQHFLSDLSAPLAADGIAAWGPSRTRNGLFHGIHGGRARAGHDVPAPFARARGRIALNLARLRDRGRRALIVSDASLPGSLRDTLTRGALYPGVGARLSRVHAAFDGQIDQVVLTIRSLDLYWSSALGHAVSRGQPVPDADALDRLVTMPRSWRDVIADVACAMPGARIRVLPFERLGGRPDALLSEILGRPFAPDAADRRLNATPKLPALRKRAGAGAPLPGGDDRWQPFDAAQAAALRETYRDDLFWLAAGADGLAEPMAYAPDPTPHPMPHSKAGQTPPQTDMTRGSSHDIQQRRMAPPRRG